MSTKREDDRLNFAESVALSAMMMSLVALSIDTMLPALPAIGNDLGVLHPNNNQLVVSLLFLGMAAGQLFYGPLSDHTGRKPAIYAGFAIFITGTLLSLFAWNFSVMIAGRIMQGLGAAGPRVVTLALVRDRFEGPAMARVLSFIMTVFILIPVLAPALGQMLLALSGWRAIFGMFLALGLFTLVWFFFRQPETLSPENRVPFSPKRVVADVKEILGTRQSLACTLASGCIFGAFLGYLSSSQQILQILYELGDRFPLYFGVMALAFGTATLANASLVMRYSLRTIVKRAMQSVTILSLFFFAASAATDGYPPLWALTVYLLLLFFAIGTLFGNLNSLAMEPLGHIAGTGASTTGSLSTFVALLTGTLIGQSYNETVLPLTGGFFFLGAASLAIMKLLETD